MTSEKRKSLRTSVLIAWILITLFAPIAVYYYIIAGNIALMGGNVYAFLWALTPSHDPVFRGASFLGILFPVDDTSIFYGIHILNPLIMSWVPVYGLFNILFAVQVVRFIQGKTSTNRAILAGLSTLILPLYEVLLFVPYLLSIGHLSFVGPIPIQLIVGLFIIWKYRPKPLDTPWE